MKPPELKAVRLVINGRVKVTFTHLTPEGDIDVAAGYVWSETDAGHSYHVQVDPEGVTCTCVFGQTHPGQSHSHSIALLIAANQRGLVT